MKGIWKDGLNLFRRDNNTHLRGHYGRERGITGVYGWREYIYGQRRADERREVIRGMRRNGKTETGLLADASEAERAEGRDESWRSQTETSSRPRSSEPVREPA